MQKLFKSFLVMALLALAATSLLGADFSFKYNGKPSEDFLAGWKKTVTTRKLDKTRTEEMVRYVDPKTKLAVAIITTTYSDFPAKHTIMYLRNTGEVDTPIISELLPLDREFAMPSDGEMLLSYAAGSSESIDDFKPLEKTLVNNEKFTLSPFGGRSSDGTMPYFNVRKPDGTGVAICVGWSGQWKADFTKLGENTLNIKSGMEITHFKLLPNEKVRTPSIITLNLPEGDYDSGFNYMRTFLLKYFSPTYNGKLIKGPVCTSHNFKFEDQTAEHHIKNIGLINDHGIKSDYYFIDTGWYESPTGSWVTGVGNFEYERSRYPEGVAPIAKASKDTGRGFLLWFEPERIMPNTFLANEHMDWLLTPPEDLPDRIKYMYNDKFYLFDMGNDTARKWLIDKIDSMIKEGGITIYRHDFNMYPLFYWRNGEPQDRQGIREIKHITGLYEYFDSLVAANDGLIIDSCASGGRRLDIEIVSRAFALIRTDYLWDPIGQQCHTYGLNRWFPITGEGAASANIYNARSGYGANFILALNWTNIDNDSWAIAKQAFEEAQSVMHLFMGDFHPLTPYTKEKNVWIAWQFNKKDTGEGIAQFFRRQENEQETRSFKLTHLDENANYRVTFVDEPTRNATYTGKELMETELTFTLEKEGATYITYKLLK